MREDLFEETALTQNRKKESLKYKIFNALVYVFITLGVVFFVIFFNFVPMSVFSSGNVVSIILGVFSFILPFVACFALAFLSWKLKFNFCIDYDYSFVSGSVRISKIINEVKRRYVIKFETSEIEKIGKCGSDAYNNIDKNPRVKKMVLSSNDNPAEGKDFYYILINYYSENILLIFECTEDFIRHVMSFTNRITYDKEI